MSFKPKNNLFIETFQKTNYKILCYTLNISVVKNPQNAKNQDFYVLRFYGYYDVLCKGCISDFWLEDSFMLHKVSLEAMLGC